MNEPVISMRSKSIHSLSKSASNSFIQTDERFLGKLQPTKSRKPLVPEVNYEKGGCDFRTPFSTSAFGKQVLDKRENSRQVLFGTSARLQVTKSLGIGPNYAGVSSMSKQILSHRRTPGSMVFGTSTREGQKKLYL
jgi:hypothetical protein